LATIVHLANIRRKYFCVKLSLTTMGTGLVVIPALWVCFWNRSRAESPASLLGTLQSMQKMKQIPPHLPRTTVLNILDDT
jgi:hypothetical protein